MQTYASNKSAFLAICELCLTVPSEWHMLSSLPPPVAGADQDIRWWHTRQANRGIDRLPQRQLLAGCARISLHCVGGRRGTARRSRAAASAASCPPRSCLRLPACGSERHVPSRDCLRAHPTHDLTTCFARPALGQGLPRQADPCARLWRFAPQGRLLPEGPSWGRLAGSVDSSRTQIFKDGGICQKRAEAVARFSAPRLRVIGGTARRRQTWGPACGQPSPTKRKR